MAESALSLQAGTKDHLSDRKGENCLTYIVYSVIYRITYINRINLVLANSMQESVHAEESGNYEGEFSSLWGEGIAAMCVRQRNTVFTSISQNFTVLAAN